MNHTSSLTKYQKKINKYLEKELDYIQIIRTQLFLDHIRGLDEFQVMIIVSTQNLSV